MREKKKMYIKHLKQTENYTLQKLIRIFQINNKSKNSFIF